jgi:pimeloyl-ACP methyl ester carboxylesterase
VRKVRSAAAALIAALIPSVLAAAEPAGSSITGTVVNGSVRLAATLDLPAAKGPYPVVVVVHASGAPERSFAAYRWLAKELPSRGIGVARYDRRGSGKSSGDFERASFPDLASDAEAVVRWLRSMKSVEAGRIAVWGMSQGGWIAPIMNADDPRIAALVIVSGAGTTPAEQMIFTTRTALKEAGYSEDVVEAAVGLRKTVDQYYAGRRPHQEVQRMLTAARSKPWFAVSSLPDRLPKNVRTSKWYYQFAFDPGGSIAKTRAPVLLLFGERDPWISAGDSITVWTKRPAGNVTVRKIAGANHFMAATTDPAHDLDAEPVSAEYSRVMTDWLVHTLLGGR